ncbi:hypothetical protein PYW08_008146 [Mythimna loreyi]|uniref:Uncharacterized protein n=1 Tax=Mythimna loreyi TaxID=667449 RepID=A0ACC2QBQ8_9NEOP|nr:hypothetical protein PYW08_008146 [Mythimna loreyi]
MEETSPEYQKKWEELMRYIPFLNCMIKRLEKNRDGPSYPRQAQLDKIRALRGLLSNKNKRMKVENLQKCEQVLLNLYAKVEKKEFSDFEGFMDPEFAIDPPTPQEKSDLEAVRNKLKIVAKRPQDAQETLPEILRVNEVEEMHTAGSKEPALFQRRPNKASTSPRLRTPSNVREEKVSPQSASKRNYTRVLVSPDSSARRWSTPDSTDEKPLFSRRSPRRSPRRYSPSYHKRERKKSLKESEHKSKESGRKSKESATKSNQDEDYTRNITLKVPEDSLGSLNTKHLFTRIFTCKDNDVDIDTLRGLRKQILDELKKTGASSDDISDLILKSYNKKDKQDRKKQEVEEGELSDSESEVIENVYGSLSGNLVLKEQSEVKTSSDKDKARKIQICLVVKSDAKPDPPNTTNTSAGTSDFLELEMYDKESKEVDKAKSDKEKNDSNVMKNENDNDSKKIAPDMKNDVSEKVSNESSKDTVIDVELEQPQEETAKVTAKEPVKNTANFYKPISDSYDPVKTDKEDNSKEVKQTQAETQKKADDTKGACLIEEELEKMEKPVEIPLLNEPTIPKTPTDSKLSEIDILQALKNEILSETITIAGSETGTPLLHQPKINKVASAKEILPKKRISIENYKKKTDRDKIASSIKLYLGDNEYIKKPSLKLTEKECERFNIQKKMSFDDDSSDCDDDSENQTVDLYSDLVPKSPDRDESNNMELSSPVIIPGDPVKPVPTNRNADVDMRTLPILSPNHIKTPTLFNKVTGLSSSTTVSASKTDMKSDLIKNQNRSVLFDPRVRRDVNASQSPSPHTVKPDRTPRSAYSNTIQSPVSNPVTTPNARSYEMTPNHQFDMDQSNKKHVYVPTFTMSDSRERENSVLRDSKGELSGERKSRFEDVVDNSSWSSSDVSINTRYTDTYTGEKYIKGQRNDRYSLDNREAFSYKRSDCPRTPLPSFGRSEVPVTSTQTFSRLEMPMTPVHPFGRAECPTTPSHHFGRTECPPTPSHSFGRSECPPTPSHSFGRSECPPTPNHPFGRSDGSSTPSHPFGNHSFNINEHPLSSSHQFISTECPPTPYYGRNECPTTPNQGFSWSDCPSTPNPSFGRSDFNAQKYTKDPRLNRKPEYEPNSHLNERDRGYYKDSYYRGSSYKSQKPYYGSDNYKSQDRDQGRNKYKYYAPEQTGRPLNKDLSRREPTVSSMSNDYESERHFSRERSQYKSGYEDVAFRRGNHRERSVGRTVYPEDNRERSVGRHARVEDTLTRPPSRGPSIRRNSIEPDNKSLSVKPYAGRAFTIDTSVNETFQKFLDSGKGIQVFEYNFNAKRQRASSVGRALVKESHCEQVPDDSKRSSEIPYKKDVFRRASSVGRDLARSASDERSFQEIKADFKTYRYPVKESSKFDIGKIRNIDTKSKTNSEHVARHKREKEYYEKYKEEKRVQNASKVIYSPKMNYRDPRMRKENNNKNKYVDPRSKKSGIVYSNDNIVKGAILASGYGVKNYKIPKIKRVEKDPEVETPLKEEAVSKKENKEKDKPKSIERRKDEEGTVKEKLTVKEKASDKSKDNVTLKQKNKEKINESSKHKTKEISKEKLKETIKESDTKSDSEAENQQQIDNTSSEVDEPIGRRSTRLSRKLAATTPVKDKPTKTKKSSKKSIISDSDSESDNSGKDKIPKADEDNLDITPAILPQSTSPGKEKIQPKQSTAIDIHTNFGLELEMFTDNVVSDPVLDNINALIADLDNDLDTSKNETTNNFMNEITLENMMQNITSPQDNSSESRDEFTQKLKAVDELSKLSNNKLPSKSLADLTKVNEAYCNIPRDNSDIVQERINTEDPNSKTNTTTNFDSLLTSIKSSEGVSVQNDEMEKNKDEALCSKIVTENKPPNENIVSTTEMEKTTLQVEDKTKIDEGSVDGCSTPDSTINNDVLDKNKSDECVADSTNEEDKSKIKKLLSMLGDGDNDKIKKKLEKLSEIVSDDEAEEKTKSENETDAVTDDKKTDAIKTVDEGTMKQKVDEELTKETKIEEKPIKETKDDEEATKDMKVDDEAIKVTKGDEEATKETLVSKEVTKEIEVGEDPQKETEIQSQETDEIKSLNDNDENKLIIDEKTQLNKDEDQENDDDQDKDESFEDLIGEDAVELEETDLQGTKTKYKKKVTGKKSKFSKKGKGRWAKKVSTVGEKRVTRATASVEIIKKPKKPPRELQQLHDDIKEMFIRDDILSATGIRMCRLAKMIDDKKEEVIPEPKPVVVLEKFKNSADKIRDNPVPEKVRKKPGPKPKPKLSTDSLPEMEKPKYKPGPKSKTKNKKDSDPYEFETESVGDNTFEMASEDDSDNSSDSENCSLASSRSFGSSEVLAEVKKKVKRKRGRGWQDGVIKPKHKKKKLEPKPDVTPELPDCNLPTDNQVAIPDPGCYTDRDYCFRKNELYYTCRLCGFAGTDIVHHFVTEHPHDEIPLSRMSSELAQEVIAQCYRMNFKAISKMSTDKYVCIFCYQEFPCNSSVLETFFWHIVSMHTGEYKRTCGVCSSETRCQNSLDIPPPPKETKGQLIGYICKKCHYTQLSIENLKKHVIRRHNDEQTAVYKINLSVMSKKILKEFSRCKLPEPRAKTASPRETSARLSREATEVSESTESESQQRTKPVTQSRLASFKSKITFEADDVVGELSDTNREEPIESTIKVECVEPKCTDEVLQGEPHPGDTSEISQTAELDHQPVQPPHQEDEQPSVDSELSDLISQPSNDIIDYPHFKINMTESGAKEYICCINGKDNHFKTTLLISMKKHVQLKHSENWDGYCFICKVIVTPQGAHTFKDCFQHYLDKHIDNFPIYKKEVVPEPVPEVVPDKQLRQTDSPAPSKPLVSVRPIHELISTAVDETQNETTSFPIIQSVVSLGAESPRLNPTYPKVGELLKPTEVSFKYEEVQAKVMSNKHRVVLETMMARDKLIKVFKCAGRFCSFTSDSAEDALLHASTHQRIGGIDALNCSYCDFDAMGNAIDLVMHVFKAHGHCQYSCGQCFYRAAASQSVGAHASRVHGAAHGAAVLRTTVATSAGDGGSMLTREQAVPYYVCNHAESGSTCKFRTYTPDKFCEHLQQKHASATSHPCYMCQHEESLSSELVQHMKTHGLKLYQCTWCVSGADNEGELLAHVSTMHPTKQPQAYLRIITNKEGTTELRVLPLAFLNKMKVPTEDVTPSATKENPVREAERSIDLEKLIGLTMLMEPQLEPSEPAPPELPVIPEAVQQSVAPTIAVAELQAEVPGPPIAAISGLMQTSVSIHPSTSIQPPARSPAATITTESSLTITKLPIKTEVTETPSLPSQVVVLDSDDEDIVDTTDTTQPVIDLSDDDTTPSTNKVPMEVRNQRVPPELLSTCPKCKQVCKSLNGLKKHFFYCYPDKDEGCKCAHCPYVASNRDNIMHHYVHDHCDRSRNMYMCGVCRTNHDSLTLVKRHLRYVHKEKDVLVTSIVENGIPCYIVNVAKREKKEQQKRTPSSTPADISKRRFWPQEIHLLPINPILEHLVYCEICEFSTKVRLNMVRHLQLHAEQQPVAQTAPVNPVPHLETNEMHFDKMVNLASSSLVARAERPAGVGALPVPAALAPRYPRHVAPRARNTCGARGCSYTSVDEPMLRRHWEALHQGAATANFRCVHCPNNQTTDTSKPITAARVLQHLKMHDDTLYACSKCHIYHYRRDYMEKHMLDTHPGAPLYIVREGAAAAAAAAATAAATASASPSPSVAPTMDLKPWQCGLCKFKSMLRPEVVEHCFKLHQSKMQFRCGYCPYRASVLENVNNHLAHSHANEPEDVIYYYYREGSLPDEADGTPRWMKQKQKMGSNMPEVKTEDPAEAQTPAVPPPPVNIDLKLVKKEVDEATASESLETMEELCMRFGKYCEPNGIKFKCPLCSVVSEDTREAMQSHLYEELQYRKWGCGLCNYKAFHKAGLTDHMNMEHFRQYDHIELPKDMNKERWVAGQLDHQAAIIEKHKANLVKQKIIVERVNKPAPVCAPPPVEAVDKFSVNQLEEAFGEFGAPSNMMYCCPKCGTLLKDETAMRDHLESELNKIRWGCTNCSQKYQTYHEAQFHCKGHDGPSRPKEAIRDPSMRAAWVSNIIQAQKKILQSVSTPSTSDPHTPEKNFTETDNNSLLVVRYEERVPPPDQVPVSRKRAAPESDDERLVIDEAGPKKKAMKLCPQCPYKSKYYNTWKEHVLKHYNLKPYSCCYCDYTCSYRQGIIGHTEKTHPKKPLLMKMTAIPPADSYILSPKKRPSVDEEINVPKVICLFCENSIPETDVDIHLHENIRPDFARKGDVVVKCCICLVLRLDVKSLQEHHNLAHPHVPVNYALFKLHHDTRETHFCGHCDDVGFKFLRDLKSHHNAVHPTLLFKYTTVPYAPAESYKDNKRREEPPQKRCARKSTTKLPGCKTVAKKSTTKLPYSVPDASDEGFSYYKTRPEPLENYANVTTLMSFCNRMMPFTLKKLSEIINIKPEVVVKDIRAGASSDMTLEK